MACPQLQLEVIIASPLVVLREVLGEKLAGLLVFGSYARPGDAAPGSDLNLAVITREPLSVREKAGVYSSLVGPVSPLIVAVGQLEGLWRAGDFIAHLLYGDSVALYASEEVRKLLAEPPPLTARTKNYLRRHSLAALGIAFTEHLAGRWVDSENYSYRAYRSAVRYLEASERGRIPFSDREVISALVERGVGAATYRRLRSLRRLGGGAVESRDALERSFEGVKKLLGLRGVSAGEALSKAEGLRVGDVKVYEEGGMVKVEILYVDERGGLKRLVLG